MDVLKALMIQWYQTLSRLSVALTVPASDLADRVDLPLVSVLLFGLVGAVAPCQLTTNASAMAYVSSRLGHGRPGRDALAYVFARVLVYTALGAVVVLVGRQLEAAAIPVVMATRKVLGPLMIVLGLGFLGVLRLRGSVGRRVSGRLEARVPSGGVSGAFLLGGAFAFTFCPTLFWLFFGLTIPLALRSTAGWTFPALFAVGTALPLLAFAGLLAFGSGLAGRFMESLKRSHRMVSRVAGVVFIVAGINDTLTYWVL